MNSKKKNEDEKPKKVKDMNRSEFEAWVKSNEERDKRLQRESEANFVAIFVKLYREEPPDKRLADYRDCFSNEDYAELVSLLEDSDEKVEDHTDPKEDVVAQAEEDIGIEETIEEQEKEQVTDFSGKNASEIAAHILDKGLRINEVAAINKALEENWERNEVECWEDAKKDWMKFKCSLMDIDPSISIADLNNYDGSFHSRARCTIEARNRLHELYDEISGMISAYRMREVFLTEIMSFVDGRFKACKLATRRDHPEKIAEELDECLDVAAFRDEMEKALETIYPSHLKSFEYYYQMIEYSNINDYEDAGLGEVIWGAISLFSKSWNYSGYDAHSKLCNDAREIAWKFADDATEVARKALKKCIEWKDEILKGYETE